MQKKLIAIDIWFYFVVLDIDQDTRYSRNYEVAYYIIHPDYNEAKSLNDIGLIMLSQFLRFNRGVGVACLPGPNEA